MNKLFLILSFCYLALCHASDHQIFQFLKMQENANAIPADLLRAVSNVESGRYR